MNASSILKRVKDAGGWLWREGDQLRGNFPKGWNDHDLITQIQKHKADILPFLEHRTDRIVKKNGWCILRSGEAYEMTLQRHYYFKKSKDEFGEPCLVHTATERVVYLFQEDDGSWTAWLSQWQGNSKKYERNIAVKKDFDRALQAAMAYIRGREQKQHQESYIDRNNSAFDNDKNVDAANIADADRTEEESKHDQLSLF